MKHKRISKLALVAALWLFSCTNVERANHYDERSSTFIVPQINYGTSVSYEGETYQTVVIGTQIWMARNLNYNASGSGCNDCAYGWLYDWATAMALPASCNENICDSQISEKHRGICPEGWHIPSIGDWDKLIQYVGEETATAGRYLKAKSGWNYYGGGTDTYGFSALPGGVGSDGSVGHLGFSGNWWSSSENRNYNAYSLAMYNTGEHVQRNSTDKILLFSVRCLQD